MTDMVKYPLHGRDVETVEGDIRGRGDFSSEAYPELYEAVREPYLIQAAISAHLESLRLGALARRPSSDPAVHKMGGIRVCKEAAARAELSARRHYLESQGLPSEEPKDPTGKEMDAYYEGVQKWATFRNGTLDNPDELAALEHSLEQKLRDFHV